MQVQQKIRPEVRVGGPSSGCREMSGRRRSRTGPRLSSGWKRGKMRVEQPWSRAGW